MLENLGGQTTMNPSVLMMAIFTTFSIASSRVSLISRVELANKWVPVVSIAISIFLVGTVVYNMAEPRSSSE